MINNNSEIANSQRCPALIISAPSSGSGKTTITAALARYHSSQGKKVTVFKVGPDFIDPMILQQASGQRVYQLDLWLVGIAGCRALLYKAAAQSDLILIEGVMGLFDGTPSSADLAELFNIPVLAVIDASAMAQTFGALAYGLAHYRSSLPFAGVIANRVNSARHEALLRESLESLQSASENNQTIQFFGRIAKDAEITLPERHLGLVQAKELTNIHYQLDLAAAHIAKTQLAKLPSAIEFFAESKQASTEETQQNLKGKRIIIIKDIAFNFIYSANIDFLTEAGADIVYASALTDPHLPSGDALYIPGGYPEVYAQQLMQNDSFIKDVQTFAASNKPILAECGGMLYLLDELTDMEAKKFKMVGLLPGKACMQKKLAAIGSQSVVIPLPKAHNESNQHIVGQTLRGHSFHYSTAEIQLTPVAQSKHHPSERLGEYVYFHNNIIASYMHWYFPSNPTLAIQLFLAKD